MMNKTIKFASAFILPAVMLLSACATTATAPPEDIVKQRAQERWDALLSKDYATAYSYYSPGYRSTTSATDFEIGIRLRRVRWTSVEYQYHNCDESTCTVRFQLGYQVHSPVPGVDVWNGFDTIDDQWIKTGGEWWYFPEEQ